MKYIKNILTIFIVCVALEYMDIVDFHQLASIERPLIESTIFPGILILLIVNSLAALRWVLAVKRFGNSTFDLLSGLSVNFKSGLFVYFLPGQLGSELSRVFLASHGKSSSELNHALSTAIIDRVIALVSMLTMASIFLTTELFIRYELINVLSALVGIGVLLLTLLVLGTIVIRIIVINLKRYHYIDYMGNILKMVKSFLIRYPYFCSLMLVYSMILNLAVAYVTYLIVFNMIQPMEFSTVALMSLVSNLSSIIPLTPGGVGISEIVFSETGAFMHAASVENLAGGYIVFRLLNIASFVIGMIFLGVIKSVSRKSKGK